MTKTNFLMINLRPQLFALLCLAACTSPGHGHGHDDRHGHGIAANPRPEIAPIPQRQTAAGFPYSNGHAGAFYSPVVVIDLDESKIDGTSPAADIESSSGWGARLGRWENDLGMDLIVQTSKHDERRTNSTVRLTSLYMDMTTRGLFWPGNFAGWGALSVGGGLAQVEWNKTYQDELTGHWQAKAMFAVQASNWFEMNVAIAVFALANPGDTVGSGGMLNLGGAFHF